MTTLQDDIEVLRELLAKNRHVPATAEPGLRRAIRIMTALAKLDAAQVEIAIEDLSIAAARYEREAAVSENEPGWASEAATYRALTEALEACR